MIMDFPEGSKLEVSCMTDKDILGLDLQAVPSYKPKTGDQVKLRGVREGNTLKVSSLEVL